jgi:hypothetical protein
MHPGRVDGSGQPGLPSCSDSANQKAVCEPPTMGGQRSRPLADPKASVGAAVDLERNGEPASLAVSPAISNRTARRLDDTEAVAFSVHHRAFPCSLWIAGPVPGRGAPPPFLSGDAERACPLSQPVGAVRRVEMLAVG